MRPVDNSAGRQPENLPPYRNDLRHEVKKLAGTGDTSAILALRDPDVALMIRVREGDDEAFREIISRFHGRIHNFLKHMVGDEQTAEDLTQETFLRVHRARGRYRARCRLASWLFTIANNLALNRIRDNPSANHLPLPVTESGTLPMSHSTPRASVQEPVGKGMERAEVVAAVRAALDSLNEKQRAAIVLSKFEEMSYEEIGKILDLGPQAVKSLVNRARVRLKTHLMGILDQIQPRPIEDLEGGLDE